MIRIGLLSDTHNYLDPEVFKHFDEVDEIWHAGDIGTAAITDELSRFKPVRAVYGNVDGTDVRQHFPEHLKWKCEEVRVWMTHIGGYPKRYDRRVKAEIQRTPPDLFITGHSHILKVMYDKRLKLLHINPGAAGKYGLHTVSTLVRFTIEGKDIKDMQVIELKSKNKTVGGKD